MSAIVQVYRKESHLSADITHIVHLGMTYYVFVYFWFSGCTCVLYTRAQMCLHAHIHDVEGGMHSMECSSIMQIPRSDLAASTFTHWSMLPGHSSCFNTLVQVVSQKRVVVVLQQALQRVYQSPDSMELPLIQQEIQLNGCKPEGLLSIPAFTLFPQLPVQSQLHDIINLVYLNWTLILLMANAVLLHFFP